jgi:hypothetical protein
VVYKLDIALGEYDSYRILTRTRLAFSNPYRSRFRRRPLDWSSFVRLPGPITASN